MAETFDVIIIGAGIAGLSAGEYLQNHGKSNFIVLESGREIGGRVRTIKFGGKIFAMGPGWVHGKKENPIYDIVQDLKIETKICRIFNMSTTFVWDKEMGKEVTKDFVETRNCLFDVLTEVKRNVTGKIIEPDKSFRDVLSTYSNFLDDLTDLKRTVLYTSLEIFLGAPISDISGLGEFQYDKLYESDGKAVDFLIKDPSDLLKITNYLSDSFKDRIEFNCKVTVIEWNNDYDLVTVIINDGRKFVGKNVIITVQSSLLAKNSILFKPELPKEKVTSWGYVPAINYCRLFAKFPYRFWPNKEWFISVLHDTKSFGKLIYWRYYGDYTNSECDKILVCHFTTGYQYDNDHFNVDKETLTQRVTEAMKNMFPSTYCEPNDVLLVSHWNNERFSGSFSTILKGIDESLIECLSKSVGPLHFAGESVMLKFVGTMQAAYISGMKVAEKCL